jgi:hypothetical protein
LAEQVRELLHGEISVVGANTDKGNCSKEGVRPEVISLPPDDLAKQMSLHSSATRGRCQHGELDLAVLPPSESTLRQVLLDHAVKSRGQVVTGSADLGKRGASWNRTSDLSIISAAL